MATRPVVDHQVEAPPPPADANKQETDGTCARTADIGVETKQITSMAIGSIIAENRTRNHHFLLRFRHVSGRIFCPAGFLASFLSFFAFRRNVSLLTRTKTLRVIFKYHPRQVTPCTATSSPRRRRRPSWSRVAAAPRSPLYLKRVSFFVPYLEGVAGCVLLSFYPKSLFLMVVHGRRR